MRDAAIVRMTVRELAPLHFGTLAIGMLVATSSLRDFQDVSESPNTWPLCVLPVAALWGGLTIGGGTKASLVHLLARPVSRVRVLAWRWGLLLAGLGLVAIPLWWIGLHQFARGPGLWSIAVATVLASAFGAQGATLSEREPIAFAASAMLGTGLLLPSHFAISSERLSWSRVNDAFGWFSLVPLAVAFVVVAAPVGWTWSRDLPVRGFQAGARHVLGSLVASLSVVLLIVWPALLWVGQPERGQLLAVVGATVDGPIVATGTRGEEGARDIVDGLVAFTDGGEQRVLWNRREQAPDSTFWFVLAPAAQTSLDALHVAMVDGPEPDSSHPLYTVALPMQLVEQGASSATREVLRSTVGPAWIGVHGELPGPLLAVHGLEIRVVDVAANRHQLLRKIRSSELRFRSDEYVAVVAGRVYAIDDGGALWSAPVPSEERR